MKSSHGKAGNKLYDYRQARGITQEQLASEIGIHQSTLHRLELNIGYETARILMNWCDSVGLKGSEVLPITH